VTSSPWRRRAPWPYDLEVDLGDGTGWHGAMLVPGQDGLLVGRQPEYLSQVTPTSYEYGAAQPMRETTWVFGRLTGGMGESVPAARTSVRYADADGVDCSIGGFPRLGPFFDPATVPAGAGPVRQFILAPATTPGNPPPAQWMLRGTATAVYDAPTDAWVLETDFGGGNGPLRAVLYDGHLTVTTAAGQLRVHGGPGGAWSTVAIPVGTGVAPTRCAVVAEELWVGGTSVLASNPGAPVVARSRGDPAVPGNWGGQIRVGDTTAPITELVADSGVLFVLKEDGVYTLNADGSVNDLTPELKTQRAPATGLNAVTWREQAYLGAGDATYRLAREGLLTPIGPERLVGYTGPVRGAPVSWAAHADWFLYHAAHDAGAARSYLLKFGTWTPREGAPAGDAFDEVWNGAIASWSKQITRLDVLYPASGPVLWAGFADGTAESTPLPSRTPDPAQDTRCRFRASGTLNAPRHDAGFGADPKAFHGVTALGPVLDAAATAAVAWRVDPAAAYAALGAPYTASGQRREFPDLVDGAPRDGATGNWIDLRLTLSTTTATRTPVLEGIALHEAVRPASSGPGLRLIWTFTVACRNRLVRRDGVVSLGTADATRALCRAMVRAPGHVRYRIPDETTGGFAVISVADALAPDRGRDGYQADLAVTAVQHR